MQLEPLETRILPATFTVTNLIDSGAGSLRQAILDANNLAGADTIEFQSGLTGIIRTTSSLSITDSVTISGPGINRITISGRDTAHRLINIDNGLASKIDVVFTGFSISDAGDKDMPSLLGAGIRNTENLTLNRMYVEDCEGTQGGAIYNAGSLSIINSNFDTNTANSGGTIYNLGSVSISNSSFNRSFNGGVIHNLGNAVITDSTFSGTRAYGHGGVVYNQGIMAISNSSFKDCFSMNDGGAIYNAGTASITNSTFSRNYTFDSGGAIFNQGRLILSHSTVVLNRANEGNRDTPEGGGLRGTNLIIVRNSIIAGNTAQNNGVNVPSDISAGTIDVSNSSYNLIGDVASAGGFVHGSNGNIVGNGAGALLPIEQIVNTTSSNNGGPTLTHALAVGSPAIDKATAIPDILVRPMSVTSSRASTDELAASGLLSSTGITLANFATTDDDNLRWRTDGPNGGSGNDFFANNTPAPVLTFALSEVSLLTDVVLWGFGIDPVYNNDVRTLKLEFSTDGGTTYGAPMTLQKARASGTAVVHVIPFGTAVAANSVRMTILDNWFGEPGNNGGQKVGLDEVRFLQRGLNSTTDQRGINFSRNRDGDHQGGALPDIGAFESQGIRVSSPNPNAFSIRPTITWNAIAGATSYFVHIENESTGDRNFHLATSTTNSYTPASDLAIGRLKIWIRPNFGNTPGNWSIPHWINVFAPATWTPMERVQLISRPTLTWNAQPGAVTYDIWVDNFSTGQKQIIRQDVPGTSFTPSTDLPIGIYRVWVRGKAADGALGGWSGTYEMLIVPGAEPVGPLSGTFDRTPTFSWNPVAGAAGYEFNLRNLSTGATVFDKQPVSETNFTPVTNLTDGLYRWHTIAIGSGPASGLKSGGATTTVIFVGGRPTLTSPVAGSSSADRTPTFTWQPIDGATSYRLFVSRTDVAQSGVINQINLVGASYTQPTNLAAGTYRAWIRAVSSTGELSPWSLDLTFSLT